MRLEISPNFNLSIFQNLSANGLEKVSFVQDGQLMEQFSI